MAKIGTFKVLDSFNITGRGIIVVGYCIDGHAKLGSRSIIEIKGHQAKVKIIGVDMGKLGDDGIIRHGLLFSFENADLENVAKTERIKEQIIEIDFN